MTLPIPHGLLVFSPENMAGEPPLKRQRLSPGASTSFEHGPHKSTHDSHTELNKAASLETSDADQNELDVGITTYVSPTIVPFQAILKKRYTDFLVNEILPDGKVVHLTNTFVSKKVATSENTIAKQVVSQEKDSHDDSSQDRRSVNAQDGTVENKDPTATSVRQTNERPPQPSQEVTQEDKQQLVAYLNEDAVAELLRLYQDILEHPLRKPKDHAVVRTEFTSDRAVRTDIHAAIRRIFSSKVESTTDRDGMLCLTAANIKTQRTNHNRNTNDKPSHHPGKLGWIERGGEYLHFTLYKENKDTMEAVSFLVRQMKVNAKIFQFAGTKDRRAVTAQRVSAYRLDAERLAAQNRHLRNAAIGDYEYQPQGLELGDLGGNEFIITLRECVFPNVLDSDSEDALGKIQATLEQALTDLNTKGFINYYGLQRFGTFNTRTDNTGLQILKGDFKAACDFILDYNKSALVPAEMQSEHTIPHSSTFPSPSSDEINRAKAIELFRTTSNTHKALELLPRKFNAENQIMRHLSRSPTDYVGALLTIPRNLRLMYVHAYQSLVWNKAASHRWHLYGDKVVEGDLVLIKEHPEQESNNGTGLASSSNVDVDADGEIIIAPSGHDRATHIDDLFERARPLSATEAASGSFTIFDIVLPLPGFDILYPSNESGTFYKAFMNSEEGGRLDPYNMRRKQKDFSLSGGYRKVMARIGKSEQGFGVSVHQYARDEDKFVETDLEKIQVAIVESKREVGTGARETMDAADNGDHPKMEDIIDTGSTDMEVKDKIAVVLKFQLGSSQYATMALRELSRGGIKGFKAEYGIGK